MVFTSLSAELYETLLQPLGEIQQLKHALIIPDGPIGYIPFEILITDSIVSDQVTYTELPYLFLNTKIHYEYAASISFVTEAARGIGEGFLGFAPAYDGTKGGWKTLWHNEEEVEYAKSFFAGDIYKAQEATKKHFLEEASTYGLLHFAMHGYLNDENPLYSALVFAADESSNGTVYDSLFAYELYNMELQAQLAVLSACNTGNGVLQKGEGIVSMARAFRYAGCPSIVTSLWAADDRATALFMKYFYQYLSEGKSKKVAIAQAKKEYIKSTRRDHPHYWAGFILVGDGDKVNVEFQWAGILWGMGLIMLLGLLIWLRRKAILNR